MKTNISRHVHRAAKLTLLLSLPLSVSGCIVAMPPALQVASLALDGMSYLTTGKSVTDHAISTVADKDCAMLRGLKGEDICTDEIMDGAEQPQMAMLPDGTPAAAPVLVASDASMAIPPADGAPAPQAFAAGATGTDLDEILTTAEIDELGNLDMTTAAGPGEPAL